MSGEQLINPEIVNLSKQISTFIKGKLKLIITLFLLGLIIGIPLTHYIVDWLLDTGLLPSDVEIIVLTPVEFIMIQVRVGAYFGIGLAIFGLILIGSWKSSFTKKVPTPGVTVLLSAIFSLSLAGLGLLYSWKILTPFMLDYLAQDAQSVGISTTWRLSSFVGFIVSLCIASVIGFQSPLITILSIKSGAVNRETLQAYRRHIWFGTFVLGAAFSPPDPLSLFLVSIPIILLFEAAIVWDYFMAGRQNATD